MKTIVLAYWHPAWPNNRSCRVPIIMQGTNNSIIPKHKKWNSHNRARNYTRLRSCYALHGAAIPCNSIPGVLEAWFPWMIPFNWTPIEWFSIQLSLIEPFEIREMKISSAFKNEVYLVKYFWKMLLTEDIEIFESDVYLSDSDWVQLNSIGANWTSIERSISWHQLSADWVPIEWQSGWMYWRQFIELIGANSSNRLAPIGTQLAPTHWTSIEWAFNSLNIQLAPINLQIWKTFNWIQSIEFNRVWIECVSAKINPGIDSWC